MSTKTYILTQDIKFGAFFVMAHTFDSMRYDKYIVIERGTNTRHTFSHDRIKRHLEKNPIDRDSKMNFANGKQFIRLRLNLADKS